MNNHERILSVFRGLKPDKIPFFSFSELIPRGSFERMLRNSGMGFFVNTSPLLSEMPNVSITKRKSKLGEEIIYQTPVGDLTVEYYTNTGRITSLTNPLNINYFIKNIKDYEPLIYMINDTIYQIDLEEFKLKNDELGEDGILHVIGPDIPFSESQLLLGLEKWSYEQYDNPKEFNRLLDALGRRFEDSLSKLMEVDYDVIMLGDISDNISPGKYLKYAVPYYEKYFNLLKSKGKKCGIHAHASLLKRQKEVLTKICPDFIESYTPPPYSDLPLAELRESVGENITILINFPETIFYEGYEKTKKYTIELLKSDPCFNKMIGFSEMGMMGVNKNNRIIFENGFKAVIDALDEARY